MTTQTFCAKAETITTCDQCQATITNGSHHLIPNLSLYEREDRRLARLDFCSLYCAMVYRDRLIRISTTPAFGVYR